MAKNVGGMDPLLLVMHRADDLATSLRSEEHTSELQSHSDLHSFPTRRSSDLSKVKKIRPLNVKIDFRRCVKINRYSERMNDVIFFSLVNPKQIPEWRKMSAVWTHCCWSCTGPTTLQHPLDRKSTRLNSSHTVISTLSLHDALPICPRSKKSGH